MMAEAAVEILLAAIEADERGESGSDRTPVVSRVLNFSVVERGTTSAPTRK